MMFKFTSLSNCIIVVLFFAASLLPAPVLSDNNDIETGSYFYTVQLVSEKCEHSPTKTWSANETLYFIVNYTVCAGGGPCSYSCSSARQLEAEGLNKNGVMRLIDVDATNIEDGGLTIETTFIDTDITCQDQSVVRLSQVLTPSTYHIGDTRFSVITETVVLEPLPTQTLTPIPGQVEGYVWHDVNEDGIRDKDEPGIANVSIELFRDCNTSYEEGDFRSTQSLTESDNQGFYRFTDITRELSPREHFYALQFDNQLTYTKRDQGSDDLQDSDVVDTCPANDFWPTPSPCVIGGTNGFTMPITGTLHGLDAGLLSTPISTHTPTSTPTATPIPTATPRPTQLPMDIYLPIIAQ